jgi:hypothetical protein
MHGFTSRLGEINTIAESSPGFIWRFTGDEFSSDVYAARFDRRHVLNMSVWANADALKEFTYRSSHKELFRDRHLWFERLPTPALAVWWHPAGEVPSVDEALRRLDHLRDKGESDFAFTFRRLPSTVKLGDPRAQHA